MEAASDLSPLILVIDALDECEGDNDIRVILQLLADGSNVRDGSATSLHDKQT